MPVAPASTVTAAAPAATITAAIAATARSDGSTIDQIALKNGCLVGLITVGKVTKGVNRILISDHNAIATDNEMEGARCI